MHSFVCNFFWEIDYGFSGFFNISRILELSLDWGGDLENLFNLSDCSFFLILLDYVAYTIFFFTFFVILIFSFFKKSNKNLNFFSMNLLKVVCLTSFFLSMSLAFLYSYVYLFWLVKVNSKFINHTFLFIPMHSFFGFTFFIDFFGIIILFISYFVGLLSFLALDNKFFNKNIRYIFFLNIFVLIVFLFVATNNVLIIFLLYELLLVPSFLLVFYISPSRKSTQASLYFVIWTQIGSFLVLCVIFYIIMSSGCTSIFLIKNFIFSDIETLFLSIFLFFGFGFKVPVWPFHYWLTKTHVEAPSGFSMYLSGFLVKTALYGFYKIIDIFSFESNSVLFSTICAVGIIDASLKMWGQTDLKKLVAYGTVQEMNMIYLVFCWGNSHNVIGGVLFCITHACLSTFMFYLVDCIYRRYYTRSVLEISGLLEKTPNLGCCVLLMCVLYSGLPGTLKFTSEFYILSSFFEITPFFSILVVFVANCLGLIGFSKSWYNVTFGMSLMHGSRKQKIQKLMDLTLREFFIFFISIFTLVLFCFISNFNF